MAQKKGRAQRLEGNPPFKPTLATQRPSEGSMHDCSPYSSVLIGTLGEYIHYRSIGQYICRCRQHQSTGSCTPQSGRQTLARQGQDPHWHAGSPEGARQGLPR